MKILHLIGGEMTGGAARGAYWLHKGLKKHGIDSKILTNSINDLNDSDIVSVNKTSLQKIINRLRNLPEVILHRIYSSLGTKVFSLSLAGYDFTNHPLFEWADIVNLHWINCGFVNIQQLQKVKKPLVWTLRDLWPMTGGCHYPMGCEKFFQRCFSCPELSSNLKTDISSIVFSRKRRFYPENMFLVGISNWVSNMAKKSALFQGAFITTIFNNVAIEDFFSVKKDVARKILNFNTKKKIILVGSGNNSDFYKGFELFRRAIRTLNPNEYFLVFFGKLDSNLVREMGFEFLNFGFLHDVVSLRLLYSAADVFVAPSLYEAFGKTIAEAMACRTPTVCFDATGPKDIVDHKINGYRSVPYDANDLAEGIKWVTQCSEYENICDEACSKIRKEFESHVIAGKYKALYKDILDRFC